MKVSLKFQIEDKQLKKLKAEAKRRGCSVAQVLRDLVHNAWFGPGTSGPVGPTSFNNNQSGESK